MLIRRGQPLDTDRRHAVHPGSEQAFCSVDVAKPQPGGLDDVTCRECRGYARTYLGATTPS